MRAAVPIAPMERPGNIRERPWLTIGTADLRAGLLPCEFLSFGLKVRNQAGQPSVILGIDGFAHDLHRRVLAVFHGDRSLKSLPPQNICDDWDASAQQLLIRPHAKLDHRPALPVRHNLPIAARVNSPNGLDNLSNVFGVRASGIQLRNNVSQWNLAIPSVVVPTPAPCLLLQTYPSAQLLADEREIHGHSGSVVNRPSARARPVAASERESSDQAHAPQLVEPLLGNPMRPTNPPLRHPARLHMRRKQNIRRMNSKQLTAR
jgi:hypothetical protein